MGEYEGRHPGQRYPGVGAGPSGTPRPRPEAPDTRTPSDPPDGDAGDGGADDLTDDALALRFPPAEGAAAVELWRRAQTRQLIREFLRAVPRAEPEATLAFVGPDGVARVLTRAELTAAIDRLRPRQRQIVRLALEERWPRQRVCDYLHHISIKTLERDQIEALDLLAQL